MKLTDLPISPFSIETENFHSEGTTHRFCSQIPKKVGFGLPHGFWIIRRLLYYPCIEYTRLNSQTLRVPKASDRIYLEGLVVDANELTDLNCDLN